MVSINYNNYIIYENSYKNKEKYFLDYIKELTNHHIKKCKPYQKVVRNLGFKVTKSTKIEQIPMLPTEIFKKLSIKSITDKEIFKTLYSSGTSGNNLSKIYLSKENAKNQIIALKRIVNDILGKNRLPMLIIDKKPDFSTRSAFNAKSAAIHGFAIFGKDHTYLLKENGEIDYNALNNFLKNFGKKFIVFGFTSLIYEFLIKKLKMENLNSNFKNGILIHGGGWKKLDALKISNKIFKKELSKKLNLINIINYYGLVEQTGSIFFECNRCGCFVTSAYSDIIIRDKNLNVAKEGEKGIIQLLSILPSSYPGHSILTEDIGVILNDKNCKCAKNGKRFKVIDRVKNSEIRGCSDAI